MLGRFIRSCSLIAIALLAFAAWVHLAILDPTNVGWLLRGQDVGQNALGLAAYLRVGNWPGTHQAMLSAPEGTNLLFTDSNPLLGLVLWPFARWMPPGIQVIGLWLLGCLMLQVLFAWLLVRRAAPDFLATWLGTALLTVVPILFDRIGHSNLCAHWLILWALWLFVDSYRARSPWWWAAVLGVAALVHPYLLVMVAAIWASALLATLIERPREIVGVVFGHGLVVALVVGLMAANGVFAGWFESTGSFGAFPMAIDALVNPANPSYTALMPSTPEDHGRAFEGFQYLGAGLLCLLAAAGLILLLVRAPLFDQARLARFCWLIPAGIMLTALALSDHLMFRGALVMHLPLGEQWVDRLDPLRASGRLLWPVAYSLGLIAILAAYRLHPGRARLLLAAALALQLIDIAPMLAAVRTITASAEDRRIFVRTPDPRWPSIVAKASAIEFHPPNSIRDMALLEEISWRAMLGCRATRFSYTARKSAVTRARLADDARRLAAGMIDPRHLYILLDPAVVPPALRSRIERIDGIAFLPASMPGQPIAGCR
ncbi:DUF6311 domain-containing protein [Sphingomonas sp. 28-63-12]|uniref:DUF6311 domain-containing protein n=1 Tax=Sphingomonas sp. 28-63-12 TaxID=1970434 RepID=UPI000BC59620|nr:MAG: hypothetical protein B7Y47_12350 [Sphingomonas sp. 28-63-12]